MDDKRQSLMFLAALRAWHTVGGGIYLAAWLGSSNWRPP
jgi:hypothetical protein